VDNSLLQIAENSSLKWLSETWKEVQQTRNLKSQRIFSDAECSMRVMGQKIIKVMLVIICL
jgi:hypothetical protein